MDDAAEAPKGRSTDASAACSAGLRGDAFFRFEETRTATEIADLAASFGDEQTAGGHVPGVQAEVEAGVAGTGGHQGQVDGGRAAAAHRAHATHHRREHRHGWLQSARGAVGRAGGHHRFVEQRAVAHREAPVVAVRALPARSAVEVPARHVEHHAVFDATAHHERDAHRVGRIAVDEVGGAVQRIDDPDMVSARRSVRLRRLFRAHRMLRKRAQQRAQDDALRGDIHLRDEIVGLLATDLQRLRIGGGVADQFGGGPRGLRGHHEHGVPGLGHAQSMPRALPGSARASPAATSSWNHALAQYLQ